MMFLLTACPGGGGARPGQVTGLVTDGAGKPLAGAEISIYGDTLADGEEVSFFPKTGADGTYALAVPEGIYQVSATYDLTYEAKRYRFTLHPTDNVAGESYPSGEGIDRDFVLKVSGLRPGGERNPSAGFSYYGGEVELKISDVYDESFQTNHFATEFPQGFTAEVTFTPEGPLADGSTGAPVTSSYEVISKFRAAWTKIDLPIGKYRVTGRITRPDGTSRDLQVIAASHLLINHAPQASDTLLFEPSTGVTGGTREMEVRFIYGAPYPLPTIP
ncbi:carboxypeptidase-like regulatory domain-containing protein [Archangium gephyra]|uniref:carboxypeptidase-like regulatory domain-containing protein n=1 Tax=Archangium gephyra TaxID=48 RepID=UPI0035D43131